MKRKSSIKVGDIYPTSRYGDLEVIDYINKSNVTVKFLNSGFVRVARSHSIKVGNVKDPYAKTVCGVGFIGLGKYNNNDKRPYKAWMAMIHRCYDPYSINYRDISYKDSTVCEEWHSFQAFAEWYIKNVPAGYQIDKDIAVYGNKVYSPDFVNAVPRYINNLFLDCAGSRGEYPIGVSFSKSGFKSTIAMFGKHHHLGFHKTPEKAHMVYLEAKIKYVKEVIEIYKQDPHHKKAIHDGILYRLDLLNQSYSNTRLS